MFAFFFVILLLIYQRIELLFLIISLPSACIPTRTVGYIGAGQECKVSLKMYDGRYVSSIAISKPEAQGESVVCAGHYIRIAGFKPAEMAERTTFPFTLTYEPAGNGRMRVTEVAMESIYGKAAMKRR